MKEDRGLTAPGPPRGATTTRRVGRGRAKRRDYEDKFRLHMVPPHGKIKLRELTTPHMDTLYRDMPASGLRYAPSSSPMRSTVRPSATQKGGISSGRTLLPSLAPETGYDGASSDEPRGGGRVPVRDPGRQARSALPARRYHGTEARRAARHTPGGPRPRQGRAKGVRHEDRGLPTEKCLQYLRRSAATFLVSLKVHPRDAMRWLGHSSTSRRPWTSTPRRQTRCKRRRLDSWLTSFSVRISRR